MIGEADTRAPRPVAVPWTGGYAKGALLGVDISCKASGLSYIYDDFDSVDDWVMVHGKLLTVGSDVYGPLIGYAAGRHKTQMLTDNSRAKVTIQDGVISWGESRVFICADERMNSYYGMAISKDALGSKVAIIRGKSSISVDYYARTTISLAAGDAFEVWYDRRNSMVRVYKNSEQVCAHYFTPTDIPHGPGSRYTGVVMSARWLLDQGPRFDSFEAKDIQYPEPFLHDGIDSLTPNANWVDVLNQVEVHRHLFAQPSLGPKKALFTSSAVRWTAPMNTDSVRVAFTALRVGSGKFRVAVRSNSAMTNWVGVQFDGFYNTVQIVTGSGPATVETRAFSHQWVSSWQQWWLTWNEATKTLKVYRGGRRDPVLQWDATGVFTGSGRYVGLSWTASLNSMGVEPMGIDAYDVTADDPIDDTESGS